MIVKYGNDKLLITGQNLGRLYFIIMLFCVILF